MTNNLGTEFSGGAGVDLSYRAAPSRACRPSFTWAMIVMCCLELLVALCGHSHAIARPSRSISDPPQHSKHGLTLKTYANTALSGTPAATSVVSAAACAVPTGGAPLSAELVGTIAFPARGGTFHFNCSWISTTVGFVWVDGHMVCQDEHAYHPGGGTTDNPLSVNLLPNQTKGVVSSLPFRAHIYYSGHEDTHVGVNVTWAALSAAQFAVLRSQASTQPQGVTLLDDGDTELGEPVDLVARRMLLGLPHANIPVTALGTELPAAEQHRDRLQRRLAKGWGSWLHENMLPIVKLPEAIVVAPALCSKSTRRCLDSCVPDGTRPYSRKTDPVGVETRVGHHAVDRSYVQYYFGGGVTPGGAPNISLEYSSSSDGTLSLLLTAQEADCGGNCSDWEVQLRARYAWLKAGKANATQCDSKSSTLGDGNSCGKIDFTPAGFPPVSIYSTGPTVPGPVKGVQAALSASFGSHQIGFSTNATFTTSDIVALLRAAKEKEEALLVQNFGSSRANTGQAIQASVMWNLHSAPAENGGAPLLPVSRVWGTRGLCPGVGDWTYIIFDWDNLFASLLAANGANGTTPIADRRGADGASATTSSPTHENPLAEYSDGFGIAVSNLIQTVKAKTASGFVPNCAAGGMKSQDRSEPPVGAKVALQLVKKFGAERMAWVISVIFNDLLDWSDWFLRKRLKAPLNLIALGSYNDQTHRAGTMQDARYESGLDDSPMYDGTFSNTTNGCSLSESGCGLMDLYDVGMSSLFVQEAFALAELAPYAGRPQSLVDQLNARGKVMAAKISAYLWDDSLGIFVNRFSANDSFYPHISPTSFYALAAKSATDEQAAMMATSWLMNASRFCVSGNEGGDPHVGLSDNCYWPLPSISASDPAFPLLGYWRGYIWGPMAQLVFWGLQNYDHVPAARRARKSLAHQMEQLMLSQWTEHRHICENYNPHKHADTTDGDCSGTRFYHWGALTGLISLMEDDLF